MLHNLSLVADKETVTLLELPESHGSTVVEVRHSTVPLSGCTVVLPPDHGEVELLTQLHNEGVIKLESDPAVDHPVIEAPSSAAGTVRAVAAAWDMALATPFGALRAFDVSTKKLSIAVYNHDSAAVSPAVAQEMGWEDKSAALAMDISSGTPMPCRIRINPKTADGQVWLSNRLLNQDVKPHDRVVIIPQQALRYAETPLQKLERVNSNEIVIPKEDYDQLDMRFTHFRVACPSTGCALIIGKNQLQPFEPAPTDTIGVRLSRYQRMLLRLHAPLELTQVWRDRVEGAEIDDATKKLIFDTYASALRDPDLDYPTEQKIFKQLAKLGFGAIEITPVLETLEGTEDRVDTGEKLRDAVQGVRRKASEIVFGSVETTLRGVRPYDLDESRSVVRLSADTMSLLGVEATDMVRITYGPNEISARVQCIDSPETIRRNSFIGEFETIDNLIGIPAIMRDELGMPGIDECVSVRRDTDYLVRKHLNLQFLSIVAWLFAVVEVSPTLGISVGWSIVVFIAVLPLVIYIALSSERNKVT